MTKKTYTVLRQQLGDRDYARGDTRELTEAEATPLIAMGAIVEAKPKPAAKSKTDKDD